MLVSVSEVSAVGPPAADCRPRINSGQPPCILRQSRSSSSRHDSAANAVLRLAALKSGLSKKCNCKHCRAGINCKEFRIWCQPFTSTRMLHSANCCSFDGRSEEKAHNKAIK
eukprot:19970-Rhodomonas_salina.1